MCFSAIINLTSVVAIIPRSPDTIIILIHGIQSILKVFIKVERWKYENIIKVDCVCNTILSVLCGWTFAILVTRILKQTSMYVYALENW